MQKPKPYGHTVEQWMDYAEFLESQLFEVAAELGCVDSPDVPMTAKLCYAQWTRRIEEVKQLEKELEIATAIEKRIS